MAGTASAVAVAGCGFIGGNGDISDSLDAESDSMDDHISEGMDASEGDEVDITVEAGSSGAQIGFIPEEGETTAGGGQGTPDDIGFGWWLDENEEHTETVEINEDETWVFWITQGSADVEAEIV